MHVLEKNQTLKQKNGSNGKRGDRRNFKVPLKLKHDSFSKKACSMNCSGGSGGNNFLGMILPVLYTELTEYNNIRVLSYVLE